MRQPFRLRNIKLPLLFSHNLLQDLRKGSIIFIYNGILTCPAVCEIHIRCQIKARSEIGVLPTSIDVRITDFCVACVIQLHRFAKFTFLPEFILLLPFRSKQRIPTRVTDPLVVPVGASHSALIFHPAFFHDHP